MIRGSLGAAGLLLLSVGALAEGEPALTTDKQRFSYAAGYRMGVGMKQQASEIDADAFTQAIRDVLTGRSPQLSADEMALAVRAHRRKLQEAHNALSARNQKTGQAYLAANRQKAGVKELASGIQYKVIEKGTGKQPVAEDIVSVHYRGTLVDGSEFDSSYKRGEPAMFPVRGVIQGWQEILPLMQEGDKWQVAIPAELAYGSRGQGSLIGPDETLLFDIELIAVK